MSPQEAADYKRLKAKEDKRKEQVAHGYKIRALKLVTFRKFWNENASAAQKAELKNKIANL